MPWKRRGLSLLTAFLCLGASLSACTPIRHIVAPRPGQEIEGEWKGGLNARMGRTGHLGLELTLTDGSSVEGTAEVSENDCLPESPFRGTYADETLQGLAESGESRLELRLRRSGDKLFGTYRFLSGDCVGEWGSVILQ